MSADEIIDDFPDLTEADISACLEFAIDREHRLVLQVSATRSFDLIKVSLVNKSATAYALDL
ncbi:DUF433 domain-containing protein [Synechococcus elongatus IITB4]|uniref:DUF433 domain-containing protein n=1 Tax=Synechococcus elongatus TaxID=32046 RepID=UPI0030CA984B